jgi:predicted nucleotidyltransferase
MKIIQEHTDEINSLCQSHKVKQLYAFGSVLTDKFNTNSDIDLIVDFLQLDLLEYADNYFDLKFALEKVFKRKIDLLEEKAIRNPFFKQAIKEQRQLLYGN